MVNENYIDLKEQIKHGSYLLPFAKYRTRIPYNFSSYPMHWHEEMEVIYVKEGKYLVNIDLNQYVIEEGSILIISPRMLHAFKQFEECSMMSFTMVFHMKMLENLIPDVVMVNYFNPFSNGKLMFDPIITPNKPGYSILKESIENLIDIYDNKDTYYELLIKAELYKMFYVFFNHIFEADKDIFVSKYGVSDNIKKVIDYIHDHYMENITVTDLAHLLNFSEAHFMRYFKKHVGVTCIEYINDYRINVAAKMLAGTNQAVGDIADLIGVSNVSYFNRMFKRAFGISPIEYRKNTTKR